MKLTQRFLNIGYGSVKNGIQGGAAKRKVCATEGGKIAKRDVRHNCKTTCNIKI